jgi:hypothetical protein
MKGFTTDILCGRKPSSSARFMVDLDKMALVFNTYFSSVFTPKQEYRVALFSGEYTDEARAECDWAWFTYNNVTTDAALVTDSQTWFDNAKKFPSNKRRRDEQQLGARVGTVHLGQNQCDTAVYSLTQRKTVIDDLAARPSIVPQGVLVRQKFYDNNEVIFRQKGNIRCYNKSNVHVVNEQVTHRRVMNMSKIGRVDGMINLLFYENEQNDNMDVIVDFFVPDHYATIESIEIIASDAEELVRMIENQLYIYFSRINHGFRF